MTDKVPIRRLSTGVPGLDAVLGGGLPEFSFNVVAGAPGAGKTTLVQQIMFTLARPDRPALYFTVLGEPPLKMLRYQQQFEFFNVAEVNASVRFVNLAKEALDGGLDEVLRRIVQEVEAASPAIVIVDSFRSVIQTAKRQNGGIDLQHFIQDLGMRLTAWQATTFLVGEFQLAETEDHPVFTVADGLVWLYQSLDRNSMVRKMQVMKMRGQPPIPGLHTFRITNGGIQVFPRLILALPETSPVRDEAKTKRRLPRVSLGVKGLDEMLGGGIPSGQSVLVAGPSGSGKTVLATQFIREGVRRGEPGVIAIFEKRPSEYAQTSAIGLDQAVRAGQVGIIHTRPLDLSIDETQHELTAAIERLKARRVVIDSLSGFELALAPTFREDFRESLYRLVAALTGMGVTVMMTAELEDTYTHLRFSPHGTAFLTDAIILQRYLELEGQLQRVMAVVKVRASAHAKTCACLRSAPTASPSVNGSGTTKGYSRAAHTESLRSVSGHVVGRVPDDRDRRTMTPRNRHLAVGDAAAAAPAQRKGASVAPVQTRAEVERLMGQLRETNERLIVAAVRAQDLSDEAHVEAAQAKAELDVLIDQLRDANERLLTATMDAHTMAKEAAQREEAYRRLSGRLLNLQDDERRRFAADLHDSMGQRLAALVMNLDLLNEAEGALDARSRQVLMESRSLAAQCAQEVRTMAYLLHPPLFEEIGLVSAVRWYVTGFTKRSGIHVAMSLDEIGRLAQPIEMALFRVVQESLTNVHRHASTSIASVRLTNTASDVVLEIQDCGHGLCHDLRQQNDLLMSDRFGVGIQGMRERIRQLAGTFDVEFTDKGTTVRVSVPLGKATL